MSLVCFWRLIKNSQLQFKFFFEVFLHNLQTFQSLINSSVFGVYINQGEDGKIVFANKRIAEILCYNSPDELLGKSVLDLAASNIDEIKLNLKKRTQGEVFKTEYTEHYLKSKLNALIPISLFAYTVEYDGKPSGLVLALDKTKEKSYEKLFFTLSQINQIIVRIDNEQELLKKVCDVIVDEEAGYLDCAIGYIDKNNLFKQIYTRAKTKEMEEEIKNLTIGADETTPYGRGSVSKAYHTKKVSLIPQILKLAQTAYWHDFYNKYNIHSACSIPILKNNTAEYILLVHDSLPNSFDQDHVHLLEEIQLDLSFALEKIESQKNILLLNNAIINSHEWVVITDQDATILDANKAVCDISGYAKEELLGKNPRVFKSGRHDKAFYDSLWKKIKTDRQTCSCRFINRAKDGSIFYLESIIMPVIYNGQVYRFVDLSRDVTKLVEYQNQLELKSKIYNTLYEINNLSFKVKTKEEFLEGFSKLLVDNLDMDFSYVVLDKPKELEIAYQAYKNNKYKQYLDKAKELIQLLSNNTISNTHTPLIKSLKKKNVYLINDIDSHGFCPFEKMIRSYGFNSCCAISIALKDNIVGSLVLMSSKSNLFNKEIYNLFKTIQNQVEFILDKLEDERFSRISLDTINSGFDMVIITDNKFNIIYANDKAVRLFGYSKQELIGAHHSVFSSKTYSKEFIKRFYDIIESGNTYSGLMKYKAKDNSIKDFYVNIAPFIEDGKITNYIAIGKEIAKDDELLKELDNLLNYDSTTGLINLISFKNALEQFIEMASYENQMGAVAIVNPLDFKKINEAFGFSTGNSLLIEIANRLKGNLKSYDRVAKLESDRFGILLKDLKAQENVLVVTSKILLDLAKPYNIKNQKISVSFNIGLSLFPKDAASAEELLNKAQTALSDAKQKGENQIGFFRKDLEEEALKILKIKADLDLAILNKEFIPYYQPYVDKDKRIVGAEALMRWHKDGKIIPPGEFIDRLEQTNLIVDAEDQLIDHVFSDIKAFGNKAVPISVNLSSKSLNQRRLSDQLLSNISYYNIPKHLLKIEILERSLLNNFDYISSLIRELKDHNIYFSLDDFDTGFSSLSYLSKLDVETLKIDISFIRDLQNQKTKSIVGSIIYLAHSLGIKTTAEGVETTQQFETLKAMECDYFQGYLFYKPMARQQLDQFV